MALSEWSFKNQLGQKRTTHDKSKFEDDKLLKQVITFTVANSFRFQKAMCFVNEVPARHSAVFAREFTEKHHQNVSL